MVELKSLVPRAIAYGTAEVIKPKNTPATRPVTSAAHGIGAEEAEHQPDEQAEPGPAEHATAEHLGPRQPAGDPFDLHQVDADDGHLLDRELLVGEVVDGALRLGVGGIGPDRPALGRRRQPGHATPAPRRTAGRGAGNLPRLERTSHRCSFSSAPANLSSRALPAYRATAGQPAKTTRAGSDLSRRPAAFRRRFATCPSARLNTMTAPGDGFGERAHDDRANRPPPAAGPRSSRRLPREPPASAPTPDYPPPAPSHRVPPRLCGPIPASSTRLRATAPGYDQPPAMARRHTSHGPPQFG